MAVTKQVFIPAAKQVKAILDGHWTNELPPWADKNLQMQVFEIDTEDSGNVNPQYVRAVWTAEAYILLFQQLNPRFDREKFLKACGL